MKSILSEGVKFPLEQLSSQSRKIDLIEGIAFGNHKGTEQNKEMFKEKVSGDVKYGYTLPIPLENMVKIKNALMAPLNIQ